MSKRQRHPGEGCPRHSKYRLTCEQFDAVLERSGGVCEGCWEAPGIHIDHDHAYGWTGVRGMVCPSCNSQLREIEYSGKVATPSLAAYLDRPPIMGNLPSPVRPDGSLIMREVASMVGFTCGRVERLRLRGEMPEPDGYINLGRTPWWRPETIKGWVRPGRGARTDLR